MHKKSVTLRYRPDIDGLRAFAVIFVVAFHAFPEYFPSGFLGVDIFFVISGYLVSGLIMKGDNSSAFDFKDFYIRRARRLFPALIAVLLSVWVIGYFILFSEEYSSLTKHIFGAAFFSSNFVLWQEVGYFDRGAIFKPLLHLWSLSIEEQFYLIWPLLFVSLRRYKWHARFIFGLAFFSFASMVYLSARHSPGTFYSISSRAWELFLGYFIANLDRNFSQGWKTKKTANFLGVLGGVGVFCGFFLFPGEKLIQPTQLLLVNISTALIIISGAKAFFNRWFLANRLFVELGKASYPIYLWHFPLFSFLALLRASGFAPLEMRCAVVVATVILGFFTYKYIEAPFRSGRFTSTKSACALFALLVFIGSAAAYESFAPAGLKLSRRMENVWPSPSIDRETQYRYTNCNSEVVPPVCFTIDPNRKKNILLVGDSHASQLYFSLSKFQQEHGFNILQINPGCMANVFFRNTEKNCAQVKQLLSDVLKKYSVDLVVFSLYWDRADIENADDFQESLRFFLRAGAKKIIVIGPTPVWGTEPQVVARNMLMKNPAWVFDPKISGVLQNNTFLLARQFRSDAFLFKKTKDLADSRVKYFSAIDSLCPGKNCLLFAGEPLWVDDNHLSVAGADLLIFDLFAFLKKQNFTAN